VSANAVPATHFSANDAIPSATDVIRGQFANGLVYYIRRNTQPEHHAELRLVVHAGSLQEDDDQRGLAHLIEHMEFEGSTHFPNRSLVNYFQSIGMTFGADINAATTFDNTTYQLRVPTGNADQLAKAFDVLQDWAGGATFDSVALAAQRQIVMDEWRRGQGVGARIQKQTFPVLYKGSRYAERVPIGDPDIIRGAARDKLVRFYKDWYRPDLMAVIAVGDFDPKTVEALIRARFAGLQNPAHERPRHDYTVPENTDPLVAFVTDTEVTGTSISVTYKIPASRGKTAGDYRDGIIRRMFQAAIGQRYREMTETGNPPFLGASAGFGALTPTQGTFSVSASTRDDGALNGLDAALTEVERIAQFGVTDAELSRIRTGFLSGAEHGYDERDKIPSSAYVDAYRANFLEGAPVPAPVTSLGLARQFVPAVTSDDIKRVAALWRQPGNRVVIAEFPKARDVLIPDTTSVLDAFDYPRQQRLTPYVEAATSAEPLLATLPTPGRITTSKTLANGITEWTLSNGIRVLLRPSNNTVDQVVISGAGPGGYDLDLSHGKIPAQTASQVIGAGGVGHFSRLDLGKRLVGHRVNVSAGIGPSSESLSASTTANDLETAFQLLYLAATQPRVDTSAIEAMKREMRASLANRGASVQQQFQDTVALTMAQHNPLVELPTLAMVDSIDPQKSLAVYRDRFSDLSDFRFVIVGHFVPDSIAPLVERYLASLPGHGRKETPKDLGIRPPTGMVHKVVRAGTEPKATTVLSFYGPFEVTRDNDWNLYALTEVIKLRLIDRLRQEMGGTYTPSVQMNVSRLPYPNYSITISFITSPERDDELTSATLAVLDSLQRAPALASDVEKVRLAAMQQREAAPRNDRYWLSTIAEYDEMGWPFDEIGSDETIRHWTAADVQSTAKKYLNLAAYARFDLLPATGTSATGTSATSTPGAPSGRVAQR
jgi:zinc protease